MPTVRDRPSGGTPEAVAIFESRLRPPALRSGVVPRPALAERIRARQRTHPVAVVEAPAGYGKTTLAAEIAASESRRVGWLTVDELDNDPVVFLTHLAAMLDRCGAAAGDGRRPVLVVIDDVHLLDNAECLEQLAAVADDLPPRSQLLLLGRHDPGVPLRDTERVVRLDASDLRLTGHEAHSLIQAAHVRVDEETAQRLDERCEGWAAGVYLIARGGRDAVQRTLAEERVGVERFIDEYLHDELLDDLPADDYDFLRVIALVDRVSGGLADAMLRRTDSAERLERLARSNGFLARGGEADEWYALHTLLRDLLRAEMRAADPLRSDKLLSRATDWHVRRGDLESATECAIAAGDRDRIAALVSTAALPAFWRGREATVERWLREVDHPATLAAHPPLAVVGAALLAARGRAQAAARWATIADEVDPARAMPDGSPAAAWTSLLRAYLCQDGVAQMLEDARAARARLAPGSPLAPSVGLCLGFALLLSGDPAEAEGAFSAAADSAARAGAHVGATTALAMLSLLSSRRGEHRAAEAFAEDAADAVRIGELGEYMTTSIVHAASARAALARRRSSTARAELERAVPLARRVPYALPWLASYVLLEVAQMLLMVGEFGDARELVTAAEDVAVRRPGLGVAEEWIASLRQDLRSGRSVDDGWVSPLTGAELRLLPLLPSYLSFRDIALRLGISRNTVKTQAISIYRKLGVASRTEAVDRARGLGLLDEHAAQADEDQP